MLLSLKHKTLFVENHYRLLILFNIDNRLKTSDLKSVNNLYVCKYYPRFVKGYKKVSNIK